jgi:hypothetical protein
MNQSCRQVKQFGKFGIRSSSTRLIPLTMLAILIGIMADLGRKNADGSGIKKALSR